MNYTHYAIVMTGYAENIRDSPSRRGGIRDAPVMPCPCDQTVMSSGLCPRDTSATATAGAPACSIGKCRHIFADSCPNSQISMEPVLKALNAMLVVTETVERERERLSEPGNTETVAQRDLNDRLVLAERALCTREGLRDRPWFKHLVTLQHPSAGSYCCISLPLFDSTCTGVRSWILQQLRNRQVSRHYRFAVPYTRRGRVYSGLAARAC